MGKVIRNNKALVIDTPIEMNGDIGSKIIFEFEANVGNITVDEQDNILVWHMNDSNQTEGTINIDDINKDERNTPK